MEKKSHTLKGYKKIEGIIEVKTGLHIGGSAETIEIGGNDNPIIKHPLTREPYIPGSSLKGKMRSLLEWKLGKIDPKGDPHAWCGDKTCPICRIFGTSSDAAELGPTRLIIRDAELDPAYREQEMKEKNITIFDIIEDKYENAINRITARANPRPIERVVSGVKFKLEMCYRVFDFDGDGGKTDEELFQYVLEGLRLIQKDALGGYGSRGCGKVEFIGLKDEQGNSITL
ncbi:MAG: type III-A CRISPR-associated RAMP protein Csm3 [candidate division KSB1 bacterium]|nr:type III-A CRISPR-associated RAMP protein Csm3 [candidate division KSB1 bacterium]